MKLKTETNMKSIPLILLLLLAGCVQREYKYSVIDPNGLVTAEIRIKSNYLASDVRADNIYLESPTGWIVEVNRIDQENHSIKLIVPPYFMVETK